MRPINPTTSKLLPGVMLAVCMAAFLMGCASLWQPAPLELASANWSLQPPQGWMHFSTPTYEMFSKDGPYLQYIFIQHRPLDKGFHHTKQKLNKTLLPHEAAEVVADNLRSDPQIASFKLLSSQPVTLDGQSGFKLVYTHTDRQGVAIRSLYYGIILNCSFFNLRYTAAQRYYFEKDLGVFEHMLSTVHFSSQSEPSHPL
jgi:hypothetical protein